MYMLYVFCRYEVFHHKECTYIYIHISYITRRYYIIQQQYSVFEMTFVQQLLLLLCVLLLSLHNSTSAVQLRTVFYSLPRSAQKARHTTTEWYRYAYILCRVGGQPHIISHDYLHMHKEEFPGAPVNLAAPVARYPVRDVLRVHY